jgi:lipoyl(octanoyl) transferase
VLNSINNFLWLDEIDFDQALQKQYEYIRRLSLGDQENFFVLGCEHPPVITLGYRANPSIEVQEAYFKKLEKIKIVKTDRGGLATAHEKGQLVIYPICRWNEMGFTAHGFVEFLFLVTSDFLKKLNIPLIDRNCITALHTSKGKVAFFGLRLKKDISYHGLSINVKNNFESFHAIKSCGSLKKDFDKIENYEINSSLQDLFNLWCTCFKEKLFLRKNQAAASSDANSLVI